MIPPWMIEELEEERREREGDRLWIDAPHERASESEETVSDRRGVQILDISPIGENVTLL